MRSAKIRPSLSVLGAVLLLVGAAGTGWKVVDGIATGQTQFPRRVDPLAANKDERPVLFLAGVSIYAIISLGLTALAAAQIGEAWRARSRPSKNAKKV